MELKEHHFNVNSKVVCIIFQVISGVLVCIHMLVVLDYFCLLCTYVLPYSNMSSNSPTFE